MSQQDTLRAKHAEVLKMFDEHHAVVQNLQKQALAEILPDVAEQLDLAEEDTEWAKSYFEDTGAVFRILKRHKFIVSFAYKALRETLIWRLSTLKFVLQEDTSLNLQCLPPNIRDNLGRPIVLLRLSEVNIRMDTLKTDLLVFMERMRVFLRDLSLETSAEGGEEGEVVLQYVMVIDVKNAPIKAMPVDMVTWYMRELQPRFHGMLAAAFVVNYSWGHSTFWGVTKHIFPASAASRLVFLSQNDFPKYLPSSVVPPQYGGHLTPLEDITNPSLLKFTLQYQSSSSSTSPPPPWDEDEPPPLPDQPDTRLTYISRFSLQNPFFGYPVTSPLLQTSSQPNVPTLRHGRRRKRDLVRALSVLFWQKWKMRMGMGVVVLGVLALLRLALWRGGRLRWRPGGSLWRVR